MAKIVLEINESFEHFHNVESESKLIQGEVEFKMHDKLCNLKENEKVLIPAFTKHSIKNIGKVIAVVECAHEQA